MNSSPTTLQALVTAMARPFVELRTAHQAGSDNNESKLSSSHLRRVLPSSLLSRGDKPTTATLPTILQLQLRVISPMDRQPNRLCDPRSLSLQLSLLRTVSFDQSNQTSSTTRPTICRLQQTTSSWTCTSISNNQLLPNLKTTNHHSFLSFANLSRLTPQWNLSVGSAPLLICRLTTAGGSTPVGVALLKFSRKSTHEITSTSAKFYLSRSLVQPLIM